MTGQHCIKSLFSLASAQIISAIDFKTFWVIFYMVVIFICLLSINACIDACLGSRLAQRSKALHLSARGVTTDTLVQIQAVSQLAVIESPIG